jgi:hypothetical protein
MIRRLLLLAIILILATITFALYQVSKEWSKLDRTLNLEEQRTIEAQPLGWFPLTSGPVSIRHKDGQEHGDSIGLMEVEFRMSDMVYTAILNPYKMRSGISPCSNEWLVGDELYIVSVPSAYGIQSRAYFVSSYRKKPM